MKTLEAAIKEVMGNDYHDPAYDHSGDHYEIVSAFAYLIGVPAAIFEKENGTLNKDIYQKLDRDKNAVIMRNLCMLRTAMEVNFTKVCKAVQQEYKTILSIPDLVPTKPISDLQNSGINLYSLEREPGKFIIELNRGINDRINNCKSLFPAWIKWNYLRNFFVIPNGTTDEGVREAAAFYYNHRLQFPYQAFLNWPNAGDFGNILSSDRKFMNLVYEWNNDVIPDETLVMDVSEDTKDRIYDFIDTSYKLEFIVDCENSDPYSFCAAMKSLDEEKLRKVSKIVLYDDIHAAHAWDVVKEQINLPIEHFMIERLKDNKSLADVKVVSKIMKDFYEESVDSFVLVSSDSDYWGLIEEMPKARFLVMAEHYKFSPAMQETLKENNIFYCYIDDFYSGDSDEIREIAMAREANKLLDEWLGSLDLDELFIKICETTRVEVTLDQKQEFMNKYLKKIKLEYDEDGQISLRVPGAKRVK